MKKNVFLLLFLFLTVSACSQKQEKEGLLWKITGKNLKQPSYLFGTAHGFSGEFIYRVSGFAEVFDSIQQLIVEIDDIENAAKIDNLQ